MDTKQIRARARENLKHTWAISIAVAAVAVLLGGLIQGTAFLPDLQKSYTMPFLDDINHILAEGIRIGRITFSLRDGAISIVAFFLGGTVQLGHARFLLNQHDGKPVRFGDLFSQFHRFGQGFAQFFLRNLYILLWTLCFFIPGVMAAYSYAMTPFLMADDPSLTASEAITRSKNMMDGHKAELFILDITFIGWAILCGITKNLGYLVLNPYTSAAHAVFYRQLTGQPNKMLPEN